MKESKEINIWWEGPFSINNVIENNIDEKKYKVNGNSIGLYQIYGSHPLYGEGVLVYIGRTKNKKGFKSRLKNRWETEFGNDTENVQIYLGTIFSDEIELKIDEEEEMIDKAEVLLINSLKPAFNSSNIKSVKNELAEENYIVYNHENYRNLYPIVDSKYFWREFKNYIVVDKLYEELKSNVTFQTEDSYGIDIKVNEKYNIWFGVDYELWDIKNIPLCLQVYSIDDKKVNNLKGIKGFKHYKYLDEEYGTTNYKCISTQEEISYIKNEIESLKKQIEISK